MQEGIDLKVSRQTDLSGLYDLDIVNGELALVNNFDTALQMSVYCERRADASEVLPSDQRRGWWGNTVAKQVGFEIGSKIWILYQSRITQNVINKIQIYAQQATSWLVEGGYLDKIDINVEQVDAKQIRLNLTLYRNPSQVETVFFNLWDNTTSFDPRSL